MSDANDNLQARLTAADPIDKDTLPAVTSPEAMSLMEKIIRPETMNPETMTQRP